jgi:predicted secreted Zn-dependent protease
VYKKEVFNEYLIRHEKYHFKITEIYARRIKKEIKKIMFFDKTKIQNIINREKKAERAFQKQYDYDTYHSYVYKQQKKYEKQIDSLLSLLKNYKEPIVLLKNN